MCTGWTPPPKVHVCPALWIRSYLETGSCIWNQIRIRSDWIRVDILMSSVLILREDFDPHIQNTERKQNRTVLAKIKAEISLMLTKDCLQRWKSKKARKGSSLEPGGSMMPLLPSLRTLCLQKVWENKLSIVFKPHSLWEPVMAALGK